MEFKTTLGDTAIWRLQNLLITAAVFALVGIAAAGIVVVGGRATGAEPVLRDAFCRLTGSC